MRKIWFGVFFLSMMWLFLLPVFEPRHWAWVIFFILGIAANSAAFWRYQSHSIPRAYALLLVPTIVFLWLVPFPFNLGTILLLMALAGVWFIGQNRFGRAIVLGTATSGLMLLLQACAWPVYAHFAARYHRIGLINPAVAFISNLLGANAASTREGLFIQTASEVIELYTTWESLGLYVGINFLLSGAILILSSRRASNQLLRLMLVLIAYAFVRYFVLLFASASFETSDLFWLRPWVVLSFLPLPLILMKAVPIECERQIFTLPQATLHFRHILAGVLVLIGVAGFVGAAIFQDPGVKKQGRVLFDEGHSDWEWMDRPFDTQWYGEKSSYNYYCLGQFLKHYYAVDIKRDPLSSDLLKNYDVLILKTPTTPYRPDEVDAIVRFVDAGGGLLLIGDHTNVFGMSTYLNAVARQFGFRFKYDSTYDLATGSLSLYEPPSIGRHPVLNQLPFYMFATSCSLQAPLFSEDVIAGYGLKGLKADYSQRSFFPKEPHSIPAIEFGLFLQMAGSKHGAGRVLLYTDSTCFSNFYMFMPGKPELILGSIQWLNRRNKYAMLNIWLLILSVVVLASAFSLTRRLSHGQLLILIFPGLLIGSASGLWACHALNQRAFAAPQPHTPYHRLVFDAEHSSYYLPARHFRDSRDTDMETFYVWTQRLGLMPQVGYNFKEALDNSDALVLINPTKPFTPEEVAAFADYVERGGRVLLMDDPRNNSSSTGYQLLQPFDIRIEYYEIPRGVLLNEAGDTIWTGEHFGEVQGGEPLLFVQPLEPSSPAGRVEPSSPPTRLEPSSPPKRLEKQSPPKRAVLSVVRRGQGVLAVLGCSYMFTGPVMGSTSMVPSEPLRTLYDLEYWLFRDLLRRREDGPDVVRKQARE